MRSKKPPTPASLMDSTATRQAADEAGAREGCCRQHPAGSFEPAPIEVWRLVQPKCAYENGRFVLLNAPAATTPPRSL